LKEVTEVYRDKLGMKLLFKVSNMTFFDCNGISLMPTIPSSVDLDHPASIIYFRCDALAQPYRL